MIGTREKRVAKRLRLTNHFMRQFFKYIRKEKEWASGIKPKIKDEDLKKTYEDTLKRKQEQLLKEMAKMGEYGIDNERRRIKD